MVPFEDAVAVIEDTFGTTLAVPLEAASVVTSFVAPDVYS